MPSRRPPGSPCKQAATTQPASPPRDINTHGSVIVSSNPYIAPSTTSTDSRAPSGPIKALLVGLAIDLGGSFLIGLLLIAVHAYQLAASGMDEEQITQSLSAIPTASWVSVVGMGFGCLMSILGGYVCTRMACRRDYSLGLVMAVISSGLAFWISLGSYSLIQGLGLTALTFACILLGTRLAIAKA